MKLTRDMEKKRKKQKLGHLWTNKAHANKKLNNNGSSFKSWLYSYLYIN